MSALQRTLALLLLLALLPAAHATAPSAGVNITNQASITYRDSAGQMRSTLTNEVVLSVQQVYQATLAYDRTFRVAAGGSVAFYHRLTNTGNGTDQYTLSLTQSASDGGDYDQVAVYQDSNDNGQLDSGEPLLGDSARSGSVTLDAGDSIALLVVGTVPAGVADATQFDVKLAVSGSAGTVSDLTSGGGRDGADGSNDDRAVISSGAILVARKSAVYSDGGTGRDLSDDTITYTVTLENVGASAASDVVLFDGIPANLSFNTISGSTGLGGGDIGPSNGDLKESTLSVALGVTADLNGDGDTADDTEAAIGLDLDGDGIANGAVINGVYLMDASLPAATTISMTYTVKLTSPSTVAADTVLANTAYFAAELDGNPGTITAANGETGPSNTTYDRVPGFYGVQADDTGTGQSAGVNDGGDDDNSANDVQYVDTVPRGEVVLFTQVITNTGNRQDRFDLTVAGGSFPAGTSFGLFAGDGATPLPDSDENGVVDTGLLAAYASTTVVVKARLPAGSSGAGPYSATLTATSVGDATQSDPTTETLGSINGSAVDLANDAAASGFNDGGVSNANPLTAGVITTLSGAAGASVSFNLYVANEGDEPDSYDLSVWADSGATTRLPAGWQVRFSDASSGQVISATPLLSPGTSYALKAEVSIPDNATPGTNQDLYFKVLSPLGGASDIKRDAVTVAGSGDILFSPNQHGAAPPCAGKDYLHELRNPGGGSVSVGLRAVSQSLLTHQILLPTTLSGGEPDGYMPLAELSVGSTVKVNSGGWVDRALVSDGSGGVAVPLSGDEHTLVMARVRIPCQVPKQAQDILILEAYDIGGGTTRRVTDITDVAAVHIDLNKFGALDPNCDGTGMGAFATANVGAAPNQCVMWQIIAVNTGVETTCNVTIEDAAPQFTTLEGTPDTVPSAATTNCAVSGDTFACAVGQSVDITGDGTPETHCLAPAEQVELRFRVRIDQ